MRSDDPPVALWLLAWHGDAADGLALLTELGMGPEDARHALASTPSLLARELSPLTAREVADRLEAMGGRVELRYPRRAPAAVSLPVHAQGNPAPVSTARTGRPLWQWAVLAVVALMLLSGVYEGLRSVWSFAGPLGSVGATSGHFIPLFASREDVATARGYRREAARHREDPVARRLLFAVERGDLVEETERAQLRGLQYFSHADLSAFFGLMRRVLDTPAGCEPDVDSLDGLSERELEELGRLLALSVALGAAERPPTGGHERAMEEGVRFSYRRLRAHERPPFEQLAQRARNDEEALCEFSLALLESSDHMHADLQRRFLRAIAYFIAEANDAL